MTSSALLDRISPFYAPHIWNPDVEAMFWAAVNGDPHDFDVLVRRSPHFEGGDQLHFTAHGHQATSERLWLANVTMARLSQQASAQFQISGLWAEPYGTTYGVQVPHGDDDTSWVVYEHQHWYVSHATNAPNSNPVPCQLIPVGSLLDIRMHGGFHA